MDLVRPEDWQVATLIFDYRGAIYGGYLRDVIAGVEPKDIDAVIPQIYESDFLRDLTKLGFTLSENPENETFLARKPGHRDVEIYFVEDDPNDTLIGPVSAPDFDVNLLALNDNGFISDWTNPGNPITDILDHIRNRVAVRLEATPEREAKMRAKGYQII